MDEAEKRHLTSGDSNDDTRLSAADKKRNVMNGTSNNQGQQKISGKAWGVLQLRKLRAFPFSIFFIVGNEFCERFSYYGLRAVLVLFLFNQLKFTEDTSTAIYHAFIVLCYLLPLLGALISDSCLGKYGTILSLSVVYAIGNVVVSVSAIPIVRGVNIALIGIGLVIIALGTGGIKPCVSAFGGDQFHESQTDMLRRFFSLFYFSINAGSVISTLLTPVLRGYVHCFGLCECFALAFGIPAILMIISLVVFILGTRYYVIKKPKREAARLYFDVPMSIATALYHRFKYGKVQGRKLLHYASPNYSNTFMNDVGLFLRVLVMFLPLPVFWALFDQQGSRWTLQATRMNGRFGKFIIQPDQVQALNPILILVFIPLFESIVYPLFAKCHLLIRPLQRMVVGMILAGLAFIVAGIIQLKLQSIQGVLQEGESKLVIYNHASQLVEYRINNLNASFHDNRNLNHDQSYVYSTVPSGDYDLQIFLSNMTYSLNDSFELNELNITELYIVQYEDGNVGIIKNEHREFLPDGGHSNIQVINLVQNSSISNYSLTISIQSDGSSVTDCSTDNFNTSDLLYGDMSELKNLSVGRYQYSIKTYQDFNVSNEETATLEKEFESGATYVITVGDGTGTQNLLYRLKVIEVDPPNSLSIFLQVPMYILLTAGEVMFSVTGLEFAYSQAPVSMKAMCQAAWLLTVAIGNFVVIIVAESSAFEDRALESFFFAILIGVVTLIFAIMSFFYKYVDLSSPLKDAKSKNDPKEDESTALIPDNPSPVHDNKHNGDKKEGELDNDQYKGYHSESEF